MSLLKRNVQCRRFTGTGFRRIYIYYCPRNYCSYGEQAIIPCYSNGDIVNLNGQAIHKYCPNCQINFELTSDIVELTSQIESCSSCKGSGFTKEWRI